VANGLHVDLLTPPQQNVSGQTADPQVDSAGSGPGRSFDLSECHLNLRTTPSLARLVETNDGMEVDDGPSLHLTDLDERHPQDSAQPSHRDTQLSGQCAPECSAEAIPQFAGPEVEQNRGVVVVAVLAERLAHAVVAP
jgi:hypothetical protein